MTIIDRVHHLRAKPRHVRERIVLGAAAGVTAAVAVAWAATLTVSGAFSLAPVPAASPVFAQITPTAADSAKAGTNFSQLLGAVGASTASSAAPTLTVQDQSPSSGARAQAPAADATVIPF